jgi:hypothetical protein
VDDEEFFSDRRTAKSFDRTVGAAVLGFHGGRQVRQFGAQLWHQFVAAANAWTDPESGAGYY